MYLDGVGQYYSCLIHVVESVFDVHTMGTMDLASSSRDGGWRCGEECRGQHLAQIYNIHSKRFDGICSYCGWICSKCGDGGKKKTLD